MPKFVNMVDSLGNHWNLDINLTPWTPPQTITLTSNLAWAGYPTPRPQFHVGDTFDLVVSVDPAEFVGRLECFSTDMGGNPNGIYHGEAPVDFVDGEATMTITFTGISMGVLNVWVNATDTSEWQGDVVPDLEFEVIA